MTCSSSTWRLQRMQTLKWVTAVSGKTTHDQMEALLAAVSVLMDTSCYGVGGGSSKQDRFGGRRKRMWRGCEEGVKSAGRPELERWKTALLSFWSSWPWWTAAARSLRPPADFIITPSQVFIQSKSAASWQWLHPAIPAARFALIRLRPSVNSPCHFP